ncbi:MAG: DUF4153 domain-containing protein [Massilia sp.]
MNSPHEVGKPQLPESLATPGVGLARLTAGLVQGLLLYLLYRADQERTWPATEPLWFAPLVMSALLVPVILAGSLGHMNRRQLLIWVCTSAAIIAALAAYDIWRVSDPDPQRLVAGNAGARPQPKPGSSPLPLFLVAGFFIAHSLVLAGIRDRRKIAFYQSHFEIAWKLLIQLLFSAGFVGVTWLVLLLGGQLFLLVKLSFLHELIRKPWFAIPVVAFAFSCAIHLTDVRPAIVQGIRALLLMLMSWVLPVMTLIVGAFILSLPATGLASLWATRHAGAVLLCTAAAFVVLINAAWQDGTASASVAWVIRASARAASLLLVPVVALAVYALALRVADHGWTDDRIIAAACLLVASCYALGYAAAALRGGWLDALPIVNVGAAFVVLATLLLLFSPVADPARLSVIDQLARLSSGKVPVDKFDFAYLRFDGARYGRAALARLEAAASGNAVLRERIAATRTLRGAGDREAVVEDPLQDVAGNLTVWPSGAHLPDSFMRNNWNALAHQPLLPECLRQAGKTCDAYQLDLTGDGKPEVVVIGSTRGIGAAVLGENAQGQWHRVGGLPSFLGGCESVRKNLVAGNFRAVAPQVHDLEVAGLRIPVNVPVAGTEACPAR